MPPPAVATRHVALHAPSTWPSRAETGERGGRRVSDATGQPLPCVCLPVCVCLAVCRVPDRLPRGVVCSDYPGRLGAAAFINVPPYFLPVWKLISPLASEHTRQKVSFSKGVPADLIAALGGEEAVERLLRCSPHIAPEPEG